jgi:Tfp pilus assembly protein PilO
MRTQIKQGIVLIIIAGLIFFVSYFFYIRHLYYELIALDKNKKILIRKLQQRTMEINSIDNYNYKLRKLNLAYNRLHKTLQHRDNFAVVLTQIARIAKQNGAILKIVQPLAIEKGDEFILHPLQLNVEGDYSCLIKFINALINSSYLIVISDVHLVKLHNSGIDLAMQVSCVIYE